MKSPLFLVSLLVLSLAAGCSTTDSRIKKHAAVFNSLSSEQQGKIRGGVVEPGYTDEMVLMALGDPDRRYTRTSDQGTAEVWAYADRGPAFSFGVGVGGGSRSSGVGGGIGISTGGDRADDKVRIVLQNRRVVAIEKRDR
jgi:hypothetical protein